MKLFSSAVCLVSPCARLPHLEHKHPAGFAKSLPFELVLNETRKLRGWTNKDLLQSNVKRSALRWTQSPPYVPQRRCRGQLSAATLICGGGQIFAIWVELCLEQFASRRVAA